MIWAELNRCNLANHIALKNEMDLCFPFYIYSFVFVAQFFCWCCCFVWCQRKIGKSNYRDDADDGGGYDDDNNNNNDGGGGKKLTKKEHGQYDDMIGLVYVHISGFMCTRFFYLKMGAVNASESFHVATVVFFLVFELWVWNEKAFQVALCNDHFISIRSSIIMVSHPLLFSHFRSRFFTNNFLSGIFFFILFICRMKFPF